MCFSDGIPAVVQLLNNESLKLKEAATQALSNLTHGNQLNALWVTDNLLDNVNVTPIVSYSKETWEWVCMPPSINDMCNLLTEV